MSIAKKLQNKGLQSKDSALNELMFMKHYKIFFRVVLGTVFTVMIVGGAGYLLDKTFKTWPVIFILSLVVSFPLAQVFIYKIISHLIKKSQK